MGQPGQAGRTQALPLAEPERVVFVLEPRPPGSILGGSIQCSLWGRWVGRARNASCVLPTGYCPCWGGQQCVVQPGYLFVVAWARVATVLPGITSHTDTRGVCGGEGLTPRTMRMVTGNPSCSFGIQYSRASCPELRVPHIWRDLSLCRPERG